MPQRLSNNCLIRAKFYRYGVGKILDPHLQGQITDA